MTTKPAGSSAAGAGAGVGPAASKAKPSPSATGAAPAAVSLSGGGTSSGGGASQSSPAGQPAPDLASRSKVVTEVRNLTDAALALDGLAQVRGFAKCAVKLMTEARRLERMRQGSKDEHATSEELWTAAAHYWKVQVSRSADNLEEYLISSGCLKIAAACSMRAYRMGQQQGKESAQASSSRASEEVAALSYEVSAARAKAARGAAELVLPATEAGRVDQALRQLAALSRAFADYDSGVMLARVAGKVPKALRGKFPTLENFSVVEAKDLIAVGVSVLAITEQMASASANDRQDEDEEDEEDR